MRNIFRATAFAIILLSLSPSSFAQRRGTQDHSWWDRIKSEKIAFLTAEMDLTPSEAQKFWPVYNKADKERFETQQAVFKAFHELDEAVKAGRSEKELTSLVKTYAKVSADAQSIESKYMNEYLKILPGYKVAKLCVGEEKFRQQQIFRLRRDPQQDNTRQRSRGNQSPQAF